MLQVLYLNRRHTPCWGCSMGVLFVQTNEPCSCFFLSWGSCCCCRFSRAKLISYLFLSELLSCAGLRRVPLLAAECRRYAADATQISHNINLDFAAAVPLGTNFRDYTAFSSCAALCQKLRKYRISPTEAPDAPAHFRTLPHASARFPHTGPPTHRTARTLPHTSASFRTLPHAGPPAHRTTRTLPHTSARFRTLPHRPPAHFRTLPHASARLRTLLRGPVRLGTPPAAEAAPRRPHCPSPSPLVPTHQAS